MTTNQLSAIERIRAEVEAIRKEHPDCSVLGEKPLFCLTLRLAEDKLRLAEAVERAKTVLKDGDWVRGHLILEDGMADDGAR